MSWYEPKISMQKTDDEISMRCEYDIREIAYEYAKRMQRDVDAAVLDMVADTLAEYGYVKVVRCRECEHMHTVGHWLGMDVDECWLHADRESGALGKEPTDPDGYCAWGVRKEVG